MSNRWARAIALLSATLGLVCGAASPRPGVDTARLMSDTPATTLQAYGLFEDARGWRPASGVTPYTLNTPLFSDYAEKRRYLYLPPGAAMTYRDRGVMDIPVGGVLIKTFGYRPDQRDASIQARPVETRLLIHRAAGWAALTYVWNAEGTEAVLKRAGASLKVTFTDPEGVKRDIDYVVPNVNQCKQCHSVDGQLSPIGPKARNLNGPYDYGSGAENQLEHLSKTALLKQTPPAASIARTPTWDSPSEPVDARARAYLDVNCGHCHSRAGFASNSGLFLELEETDASAIGVGKRPVAAGRASGGFEYAIAPGDPDHSIIVHRMASTEPGVMMPQLGRSVTHADGLALVRAYIAQMKPAL